MYFYSYTTFEGWQYLSCSAMLGYFPSKHRPMNLLIHTSLLWFIGYLYSALVVGIGAVLMFLVLTERAGATRHTRAAAEAQAAKTHKPSERITAD
jgi:hypothetical protein